MAERLEAPLAAPGSSHGAMLPLHSVLHPSSPNQMLHDVEGTQLRVGDVVVMLGSPETPAYHGVIATFCGRESSAFGDRAKVGIILRAPVRKGSDIERTCVPPSMLRVLASHEARRFITSILEPRTLSPFELELLHLPSTVSPASSSSVTPGRWTPSPSVPRRIAPDEEIDEAIAQLDARMRSVSVDPSTVRSRSTGTEHRVP